MRIMKMKILQISPKKFQKKHEQNENKHFMERKLKVQLELGFFFVILKPKS